MQELVAQNTHALQSSRTMDEMYEKMTIILVKCFQRKTQMGNQPDDNICNIADTELVHSPVTNNTISFTLNHSTLGI